MVVRVGGGADPSSLAQRGWPELGVRGWATVGAHSFYEIIRKVGFAPARIDVSEIF